jgi:hypothetical protein
MKRLIIVATLALATAGAKADTVLVLNDSERAALISGLAAGLQAQPQLSPITTYLLSKINTAPTMTSQKEVKPDEQAQEAPKDSRP